MRKEQSQQIAGTARGFDATSSAGVLFLVSVPIGHPNDLSARALQVLRQVDIIASENPAATRALLIHHQLKEAAARLTSYGPVHLTQKVGVLLHRLQAGARIAMVSDCGSPLIADPGGLLVSSAHAHGIRVVPVPGPSAITAAVMASGFPADRFSFLGQVPTRPTSMKSFVTRVLEQRETTVVLCEPDAVAALLHLIARLAPRRQLTLACDMTEETEFILRGTAFRILEEGKRRTLNAVTLVVAGARRKRSASRKTYSLSSRRIRTR